MTIVPSYQYESIVSTIINYVLHFISFLRYNASENECNFKLELPVIFMNINKAKNINHKFLFQDTYSRLK